MNPLSVSDSSEDSMEPLVKVLMAEGFKSYSPRGPHSIIREDYMFNLGQIWVKIERPFNGILINPQTIVINNRVFLGKDVPEIIGLIIACISQRCKDVVDAPFDINNIPPNLLSLGSSDIKYGLRIWKSATFAELESQISALGRIEGSKRIYTAQEILENINKVRNGDIELEYITNTYGIREAVGRLLRL